MQVSKTEFNCTLEQMDNTPLPRYSKTARPSQKEVKQNKLKLSDSFGMDDYQQFIAMSKQHEVKLE